MGDRNVGTRVLPITEDVAQMFQVNEGWREKMRKTLFNEKSNSSAMLGRIE